MFLQLLRSGRKGWQRVRVTRLMSYKLPLLPPPLPPRVIIIAGDESSSIMSGLGGHGERGASDGSSFDNDSDPENMCNTTWYSIFHIPFIKYHNDITYCYPF